MSSIQLSERERQELYERFVNDPIRKQFADRRYYIISRAFPTIIIDEQTREMTRKYSEAEQRELDRISQEESEYIARTYPIIEQENPPRSDE